MDSFQLNKYAGAFLATVFVLFTIKILAESIFHVETPEQFGYVIEAAEGEGAGAGEAPDAAEAQPIAPLLASADTAAGETVFKKCAACHTWEKGGANKVGPNLWDIVNRPIASHEGFSYSTALQEYAQGGSVVWDYEELNGFFENPKKHVKGTAMGFAGLKKIEERANLIAWMRTHSDNPVPLP